MYSHIGVTVRNVIVDDPEKKEKKRKCEIQRGLKKEKHLKSLNHFNAMLGFFFVINLKYNILFSYQDN